MSQPISTTIPALVHEHSKLDRVAAVFDSENISYTFSQLSNETEMLAAGLLSSGLEPGDRVLICGSNNAHFFTSTLACARGGLIFSLINPNFANAGQLHYALKKGEFRAIICFPANKETEFLNNLLNEIAPELKHSAKGHLSSRALPMLTHIIMAEEDHKHAGTFTLSEIFGRSNRERIEKLPNFEEWSTHQLAAIQFTTGTSAPAKLVGLSHYQLINGCRVAAEAMGVDTAGALCCALPLFKIPVFALVALAPFVRGTRVLFPSPSPLPKFLFDSIKKHQCAQLLTNAVALRLVLKIALARKIELPSVKTVILIGERVPLDLLKNIPKQFQNANKIFSGYMLTEAASVPIITSEETSIVKNVGKPLRSFTIDIVDIGANMPTGNRRLGELRIRPVDGSRFLGYGPTFDEQLEWINTGDIVVMDTFGGVELLSNKGDLIFDESGKIIEHWTMEKAICAYDQIKGAQIIALAKDAPLIAVLVLKTSLCDRDVVKSDIQSLCKNNGLPIPDMFAFVDDFPRINTKIQKYRLREMIKNGELKAF
uniref:AMP-dependent synthetase/ligase domain-containing protein n=1 Tax=Parascaris univalens TaxID=6257 RepID=A0A915BR36_PARUN